jgi:hypothetical protein
MTRIVVIQSPLVALTTDHLRAAGAREAEGVVLWLARPHALRLFVNEVYVPRHEAAEDYFHIPPEGLDDLMQVLRTKRLMVAAQVHSHPAEAFHSPADNKWAIVRHIGALSIVVPFFARGATAANFIERASTFALSPAGEWTETPRYRLADVLQVEP